MSKEVQVHKLDSTIIQLYEWIGFDAESIVKYNMQAFRLLCVESYLWDLHKTVDYPKEIMDFDYEKHL